MEREIERERERKQKEAYMERKASSMASTASTMGRQRETSAPLKYNMGIDVGNIEKKMGKKNLRAKKKKRRTPCLRYKSTSLPRERNSSPGSSTRKGSYRNQDQRNGIALNRKRNVNESQKPRNLITSFYN